MDEHALTEPERRFIDELNRRGVRYMIVGLAAALLQGANTATQDIDLWFETLDNPRIGEAARAVGGIPMLGGALGDRFDVVLHMSGLASFEAEYVRTKALALEDVTVRVLPLDRILESKRAARRPKDLAAIPALEEAIAALEGEGE